MKVFKKIACSVLALGLVLGLTACKTKEFDHKMLADFCEEQDFEEYDEYDDFFEEYGKIISFRAEEEGVYMYATKGDAQDLYDDVLNRFKDFPDYDVSEATLFAYSDKDQLTIGYLFTFEETKEAEKLFKKYSRQFADEGESGEEKGYSYSIETGDGPSGKDTLTGVYLKGNTVLIIRSMGGDSDLADDMCETFKVISPSEA